MKIKNMKRLLSIGSAILMLNGCAGLNARTDGEMGKTSSAGERRVVVGEDANQDNFNRWLSAYMPHRSEPEIEKKFIPDRIQGNVYETAHWRYTIKSQSKWQGE